MMKIATDKKIAFGDNSIRFSVVRKVFYTFLHHKKIIEKTIIGIIAMSLVFSSSILVWAEDYPAGFVGPGYREPLSEIKQSGYNVNVFTTKDQLLKERVNKRNQAEEISIYASQAGPQSADNILGVALEHINNINKLNQEIAQRRQELEKMGESYIPHSDGSIVYFKDGLVSRIKNERVVDEYGNVSYRNSDNYKYDDNRLLIGFEANIKDSLGNITHTRQFGIKYTADSKFYGNNDTNANKNVIEYFLEEIDPAGNKRLIHFNNGSYEGKLLRAYSQTIEDSIYGNSSFNRTNITYANNDPEKVSSYYEEGIGTDGLAYTLDRTNISYNDKGQVTDYHEEKITTHLDGGKIKTIVDAKFNYLDVPHQFGKDVEEPDPDRLLESVITTTTENPDGSKRTETNTTTNNYDGLKLIGASGHSEFNGQEADWWQYTDLEGHTLSRSEDEGGNITYSYVDPDTKETITVTEDQVIATLKDGNLYQGTSEIQYEVLEDRKPITRQTHSRIFYYGHNISESELIRVEDSTVTNNNGLLTYNLGNGQTFLKVQMLDLKEHTETSYPLIDPDNSHLETYDFSRSYAYDEKGNLKDVILTSGTGKGWEYQPTQGWYGEYTSAITEEYEVILGKPVRTDYYEDKDYKLYE